MLCGKGYVSFGALCPNKNPIWKGLPTKFNGYNEPLATRLSFSLCICSSSYNGKVQGSCFPAFFGGSCTGTPSKCDKCNTKCSEEDKGMTITVKIDDNGNINRNLLISIH